MSLEGQLRELGLPEVLQLLSLSRKSGTLHVRAPLQGRAAFLRITQGAVVDAMQWKPRLDDEAIPAGLATSAAASRRVEACALDVLTWRDGDFRFMAANGDEPASPVRIAAETLLMEAAQRAEGWERIADRIAHAHVVPAFVDVEPQQLPLLRLVPQEWEILTRVDGKRELTELAALLGREVLDVAGIVHGLIGAGLLTLREIETAPRRNPTPPAGERALVAANEPTDHDSDGTHEDARDLWIPDGDDEYLSADELGGDNSIFDPIEVGVQHADGMPRRRGTPLDAMQAISRSALPEPYAVAPVPAGTSLHRVEERFTAPGFEVATMCAHGDDAARRGDFPQALECWSAALRSDPAHADADRIREAIALTARLHALLHSAARHA